MKYTCNVSLAGTYTIEFRVANGGSTTGIIQVQNADGTEILATADVPKPEVGQHGQPYPQMVALLLPESKVSE